MVEMLTIDEGLTLDYPPALAVEYLARHGIAAAVRMSAKTDGSAAEAIMAAAQTDGAAYLVMGAFGHSRAREYLFGGVTRRMLGESPLPLLLAH